MFNKIVRRVSDVYKHRTVPGQCRFTLNSPTKLRTVAEEFLVVQMYLNFTGAPYDV